PVGFSSFWKGDLNVIYSKYYSEKKLTSEEIELRIKKIMSKPIPSYAGVGNVHLGFTLPFQKWSVSKEQVRFLYLFEEQAVFENKSFNKISVPIKNLPETEQKYIHDLIEIPKTGIMPVWKDW
ncbi:MAG: hypothetical protein LBJ00_10830, partial [Planctomycetaceae bacterium]|nr:hypothetical protein [Planctomycetaceae bacterium]